MFYLKPTSWTPTTEFIYAIKVDGELHPCTYQRDYNDKTTKFESFIRGTGWKKSKKGYKVPVFKGSSTEEMQAYIEEHGKYCLFYSITGFQLDSGDCVVWAAQQEFKVSLSVGFEYVQNFCNRIQQLNAKIQAIVLDKHGVDVLSGQFQKTKQDKFIGSYDLFYVKPNYSVMAYFLTKPHVDVISDDNKLHKHYVNVFGHDNEDEFPVSMKARLEFLFSKEVAKEYEAIMKEFSMG